jgi:polysaccharide export outer membrane protein
MLNARILTGLTLRVAAGLVASTALLAAQGPAPAANPKTTAVPGPAAVVPTDYVVGPEDVLGVLFWREADMSGDVTVRPDGRITLPLVGEMNAAGLPPDALRDQIQKAATKYLTDPTVTVVVRTINSRKVYITGQVASPGVYPLVGPRNVLQLIAMAGGLNEYAKADRISITRVEPSGTRSFKFNYKDVEKGKNLGQNILLKPGDTVLVP